MGHTGYGRKSIREINLSVVLKMTKIFSNLTLFPIAFLDYLWAITIYVIASFGLAVLIDGYLLPKYSQKITDETSTLFLAIQVIAQLALQGFIAILLCAIAEAVPSPVQGIHRYTTGSTLGKLLRNPALISVILFTLSKSLQGRLNSLFYRFRI